MQRHAALEEKVQDVDQVFIRKCNSFSAGDTRAVAASLSECSYVTVGTESFHFENDQAARSLLDRYRSGLAAKGYAHTLFDVKEVDVKGDKEALVVLNYSHLDWNDEEIDTFEARYILSKDECEEWRCFFVEFPTKPVAFNS